MSQPPEQPPLAATSSLTSTTSSTARTPTPDHSSLTTPPPRTLSNILTPSLPAGVPSPLIYTPSLPHTTHSPAFSTTYSPHPHPRSSSFPPPTSQPPPAHLQPSRVLAEAGQRQLADVLSGVYKLLSSYQQLSAVDSANLQSAAAHRTQSDSDERSIAAAAQRQRADVEAGLASLQSTVATLVERETPKLEEGGGGGGVDEERVGQLVARRDYLLALVCEGNADVVELVGRLRGLHRSLGLFAHEHDAELRVVPISAGPTQPAANNARR